MKLRSLSGFVLSFALLAMFGCGGDGGGAAPPVATETITATPAAGGTIAPLGEVKVVKGKDQTFTITPNAGFFLSDVLVDGVSVGAVAPYTFTNVTTSGHTITPVFLPGPPVTATVELATQGTLPVGSLIGSIVAVFNYPQDKIQQDLVGVPVQADGLTPVIVVPSGVAPIATTTVVQNLTIPGQIAVAPLSNPNGLTTGEFATVTLYITPGTVPTAADFSKATGFFVFDLGGNQIFGFNDSNFVLRVTIQ